MNEDPKITVDYLLAHPRPVDTLAELAAVERLIEQYFGPVPPRHRHRLDPRRLLDRFRAPAAPAMPLRGGQIIYGPPAQVALPSDDEG